jgi:hypothetical protein
MAGRIGLCRSCVQLLQLQKCPRDSGYELVGSRIFDRLQLACLLSGCTLGEASFRYEWGFNREKDCPKQATAV